MALGQILLENILLGCLTFAATYGATYVLQQLHIFDVPATWNTLIFTVLPYLTWPMALFLAVLHDTLEEIGNDIEKEVETRYAEVQRLMPGAGVTREDLRREIWGEFGVVDVEVDLGEWARLLN